MTHLKVNFATLNALWSPLHVAKKCILCKNLTLLYFGRTASPVLVGNHVILSVLSVMKKLNDELYKAYEKTLHVQLYMLDLE